MASVGVAVLIGKRPALLEQGAGEVRRRAEAACERSPFMASVLFFAPRALCGSRHVTGIKIGRMPTGMNSRSRMVRFLNLWVFFG